MAPINSKRRKSNSLASVEMHDWTFNGASTRELTHCYHDYPARMIPQVAGKLLDMFAVDGHLLFDPYCGTGTSLVEALIRGVDAVGTDLNPLARLIACAKTSIPDMAEIDRQVARFKRLAARYIPAQSFTFPLIPGIRNLDFWFKPEVIQKLERIRKFVGEITDESVRSFFEVAFSETVRESSNTRNEEFKLYRYDGERLKGFNPNPFHIMCQKLERNRKGLDEFAIKMHKFKHLPAARIYDFNTVSGIPLDKISVSTVDIVVTSPPYGDSHTTVAYGQYSRLSAAWLGLNEADRVDSNLMGGKVYREIPHLPSESLNFALDRIGEQDPRRASEVASFYYDLYESISQVSKVIKPGGYACYVVGNRKVKGVVLPTADVICSFFESFGFGHVDTFHRSIPNKRMPLRNSPTNVPGQLDSTMTQEHIVVMRLI